MNDEKISLRIEGEVLQKIDDYLDAHPGSGSRSLFIKNCIRERLDRDAQASAEEPRTSPNTITVTLPGRLMAALENMISEEYVSDYSDAILMCIRDSMREVRDATYRTGMDGVARATPETR